MPTLQELILSELDAMAEDRISCEVLVPMLEKMGFLQPCFTGGATEKGIDVLCHEMWAGDGLPRFTGIQMKKGDIRAKASGGLTPAGLEAQIAQAFDKPVGLLHQKPYTRISTLVIGTTGTITEQAREEIEEGTQGLRRRGAPIRFWDGANIAQLVLEHFFEEFTQLTSMDVPEGVQPIIIQGEHNVLTVGIAMARAGNHGVAVVQLEHCVRIAARQLADSWLAVDPRSQEAVQAAETACAYDRSHYNAFWIAGYSAFLLDEDERAERRLLEAIAILERDQSAEVQRGLGFQIRHLQAIAMLIAILRRSNREKRAEEFILAYREKEELVRELGGGEALDEKPGVAMDAEIPAP